MNASELLRGWPSWRKANAETILASPAWRLAVDYGGEAGTVTKAGGTEPPARLVTLKVTLDGEPRKLAIDDSGDFRDLHLLREKLGSLPDEIVLALVEKECGTLLQTVENTVKRQLRIEGLADAMEGAAGMLAFTLAVGDRAYGFAVESDAALVQELGNLKNLDAGHEAIRSMTRGAEAEYAVFDLLESEVAAIVPGARLLLPEDFEPVWRTEAPADDLVHLRGGSAAIAFSAFADDALPAVPDAGEGLRLVRRGVTLGAARMAPLGSVRTAEVVAQEPESETTES